MLENFRLRVFREVARQSNFRRAAEVLYLSQPAVTQQIKALEAELGVRVFDRSGAGVRLTAAGALLLARAEEAEITLSRAVEEIAALDGELKGTLRVHASTTIAQYVLPPVLAAFARRHPGTTLELGSANTERVVAAVAAGESPLGLIEGPAHRGELLLEPWLRDELVLVVSAAHEWAGTAVPLAALKDAPLLLREQGSGTRAVLEAALAEAGLPPGDLRVAMELGSTEALLACVEAGLGVGFASRFALRRQIALRTLTVVPVEGLCVRRQFQLVRPRGPLPSGVTEAFLANLQAFAADVTSERMSRRQG